MNLFRFFSKPQSAPAARERLQVLLAHERASVGDNDLVTKLRDEILRVISKHMQINEEKVSVKMERGDKVSTLEVDIEIPLDAARKVQAANKAAATKADATKKPDTGKKDDPDKKAA